MSYKDQNGGCMRDDSKKGETSKFYATGNTNLRMAET